MPKSSGWFQRLILVTMVTWMWREACSASTRHRLQLSLVSASWCLHIPVPVNSRRQIKPESPDVARPPVRLVPVPRERGPAERPRPSSSLTVPGNPVYRRDGAIQRRSRPAIDETFSSSGNSAGCEPGYIRICCYVGSIQQAGEIYRVIIAHWRRM